MKRDRTDILFSKFIKLKAGGYCQYDQKYFGLKSRGLHCAHCFSRGRKSVRFDPKNAACLCWYHHIYLDHHPLEKIEFFIGLLGQKEYKKLAFRADHPQKPDIEAIEKDLKEKIKFLEGR